MLDPTGNFAMAQSSFSIGSVLLNVGRSATPATRLLRTVKVVQSFDTSYFSETDEISRVDVAMAGAMARVCVSAGKDDCELGIPTIILGADMWDATQHYWDASNDARIARSIESW